MNVYLMKPIIMVQLGFHSRIMKVVRLTAEGLDQLQLREHQDLSFPQQEMRHAMPPHSIVVPPGLQTITKTYWIRAYIEYPLAPRY